MLEFTVIKIQSNLSKNTSKYYRPFFTIFALLLTLINADINWGYRLGKILARFLIKN